MLDLFRLDGQVAVVTGGGTGIGRAIALGLAGAGCDVVLAGRRPEPLAAVAAEIEAVGRRALAVPTDVTVRADLDRLPRRARSSGSVRCPCGSTTPAGCRANPCGC